MDLNYEKTGDVLRQCRDVLILCHQNPDGDTLGSGFALMNMLRSMGKNANVVCQDGFPDRYDFLYEGYEPQKFEPKWIIAVDIADQSLFGKDLEQYRDKVNLCIDHHISNTHYAAETLVNPKASAACEVLYRLFAHMKLPITRQIARCLYTGISTDTGCFKFENTTRTAHLIASALMAYDIDYAYINRMMFDIKSRGRLQVEQYLNSHMEYYFNDRCALVFIGEDTIKSSGMAPADFEGTASLPLQIESVEVGITAKERESGVYKLSLRSAKNVDVSSLCQKLGGGGHIRAAGCTINGTEDDVRNTILPLIKEALEETE